MLSIYVSFVVAYFTLYFWGYPIKVLLLNGDLKKFDLYITPWLGIGVIITVLFPLSWLGFSVESVINYVLAAMILLNAALWLKYREPMLIDGKEALLIFSVGFAVASMYFSIIFMHDFEYYVVSSNADIASYLVDARAALVSSAKYLSAMPGGVPNINTSNMSLNSDFRGCLLVMAHFAALFKLDLAHIIYPLTAFAMFLNIILFRLFLKKNINNILAVLPLVGILCFNTTYQRLIFSSFIGQLYSIGIVILAVYIAFYLAEKNKFDRGTCILLVFVLTLNGLNYIEAMAYPLVPIIAFALAVCFSKRNDKASYWKNAAFTCGLYLLINFYVIIKFVGVFSYLEDKMPGWPLHLATMVEVAGVYGAFSSPDWNFIMIPLVNCLLIGVLAHQIKREGISSFLSVACVAFFLLYAAVCVKYFRLGDASSYNSFKAAISFLFIFIIMLIRFLEEQMDCFCARLAELRGQCGGNSHASSLMVSLRSKAGAAVVIFTLFFALSAKATYSSYLRPFITNMYAGITKTHEALRMFSGNPYYSDADFIIYRDNIDAIYQRMAEYHAPFGRAYTIGDRSLYGFLLDEKSSFKSGDIYIANTVMNGIFNTTNAAPSFVNDIYSVFELNDGSVLFCDFDGMDIDLAYIDTPRGRAFVRPFISRNAGLYFMTMRAQSVGFAMTFFNAGAVSSPLSAKVYVNGEMIGEFKMNDAYLTLNLGNIHLKEGVNSISFEFDGDVSGMYLVELGIG